ncbi:malonyl-CoA O-methyltransferase [Azospirillaceae bacterium]
MTAEGRKIRIARAFSSADAYDQNADTQLLVAERLAERISAVYVTPPKRVLEIGCGTGFLSQRLRSLFPESALVLTDMAPAMLERARLRVGEGPLYREMDGEAPNPEIGAAFDLITSSLVFQWFQDLPSALVRLAGLLAPNGRLMFATLGEKTFGEWREAHLALGVSCGLAVYPAFESFPWPLGAAWRGDEELILRSYSSGRAFVRMLKSLGAGEPAVGHRPATPGEFRRLLASLDGGLSVTYHVIFGDVIRNV